QVMESGRRHSHGHLRADCGRQIGVTLQTDLLHNGPRQHPQIGRPVRLVAGGTALETNRRVLKSEWAALVAMAFETARLSGGKTLSHRTACASVRVVAIDARHRDFRHAMVKMPLNL